MDCGYFLEVGMDFYKCIYFFVLIFLVGVIGWLIDVNGVVRVIVGDLCVSLYFDLVGRFFGLLRSLIFIRNLKFGYVIFFFYWGIFYRLREVRVVLVMLRL